MLLQSTSSQRPDTCPRCGADPDKIYNQRVAGLERGYVNILQCQACGYSDLRKEPQAVTRH